MVIPGLFLLAGVSGMLGLGVASAAVPFLSLFLPDLVHQVQPLSLLLNGVTALFAVFGFAQSGLVGWRKAFLLALVTPLFAPVGAWLMQRVEVRYVWWINLGAVAYLGYNLFLVVAGALGSYLGSRLTNLYLPSQRLKQLFGVLILAVTPYKVLA